MRTLRLVGAAAAVLTLPACATVVRGTKTSYSITSVPPAADVALSTGENCVTPCKLKLKRKNAFTATISKAGYKPRTAIVESKFSGGGGVAAAGNILAGGIIGGVVDGRNGSLNSFYPGKLDITLEPGTDVPAEPSASPAMIAPAAASSPD